MISPLLNAGVADLAIGVSIEGIEDGVEFGETGNYTIIITNNGPDIAADGVPGLPIAVRTSSIPGLQSGPPIIDYIPDPNNDVRCFFTSAVGSPPPFGTASYAFFYLFSSINQGESIECSGTYLVNIQEGSNAHDWFISNNSDTDPISANNRQSFVFGVPPKPVPTIGITGLLFMVFLILLSLKLWGSKQSLLK